MTTNNNNNDNIRNFSGLDHLLEVDMFAEQWDGDKIEHGWVAAPVGSEAAKILQENTGWPSDTREGGQWLDLEMALGLALQCEDGRWVPLGTGTVLGTGEGNVPGLGRSFMVACSSRKGAFYTLAHELQRKTGEKVFVRTREVDPYYSQDRDEYIGG